MQEVLKKIVATEAEARRQVQAAQAEAGQLLARARLEAQGIRERANQDVRVAVADLLAANEAEANTEKTHALDEAAARLRAACHLPDDTVRQAVAAVLRCVCGQEDPP
jgi:vacuolar-type H+-ATPase subunit H